jgi:hypothetical protein
MYVVKVSLIQFPSILAGKNWTTILNEISTSDSTGLQIREGANLITSVICKMLTNPSQVRGGVCSTPPINITTFAGPYPLGLDSMRWSQAAPPTRGASLPAGIRRLG